MTYKSITITKYVQSGFRIDWRGDVPQSNLNGGDEDWQPGEKTIYIDPFRMPDSQPSADVVLFTHEHFDHCDPESLQKILKEDTHVIGNKLVQTALSDIQIPNFSLIEDQIGVAGFLYSTLPAYNTNKFRSPGNLFHPPENNGVGFLLTFNIHSPEDEQVRVYHMGDTDFLGDEQMPVDVDILMVPVSGTYVMTADEAAEAVKSIKPQVAIPMHYDAGVVGSRADAEKLQQLTDVSVEILDAVTN